MATKEAHAIEKREAQAPTMTERLSERKVYMPRTDIYETDSSLVVLADMPGVDERSVDVTLDQNILTISGKVEYAPPAGHHSAYSEYEVGDYERTFELSDEVDREGITASVKNGVLKLTLPKSGRAQTKKIAVKGE